MVVKGYPFQKGFDHMKKFYLAYGSNLNVKQMQFRCPDARIVGTAEIPNYQLLFKGSKTGSYLTIEPKRGCTVPAAVWSVSERDELALDRYEGYPHFYYKTELELPLAPEAPTSPLRAPKSENSGRRSIAGAYSRSTAPFPETTAANRRSYRDRGSFPRWP